MDQKSLCELQVGNNKTNLSINKRDKFLIDYIQSNCNMSKPGVHIAELSVGDGSLSRNLAVSFNNATLSCADISPSCLRLARDSIAQIPNAFGLKVEYLECNFDTQFGLLPSSKFDILIALDIMEHVFDVFNFVENCGRILKQDGILFLRVPNIAYIRHRIRLLFGALPITSSWFGTKGEITAWRDRHGWDGGHLHYFNIPVLYQLLNSYGFEIVLCKDPGGRFSSFRNLSPKLLYGNLLVAAKKT